MHLATHLLHDAHMGACEVAVVVSNDSDRLEPITIVRGHLGKNVGVLNPQKHPSRAMLPHIDFIKQIRHGTLHAAQLPATLTDQPRHVYEASRLVTAGRRVPYARFARPHVFLPAAVPAIKGGGGNDSVTHVSASLRSNALWRLSTWGKP